IYVTTNHFTLEIGAEALDEPDPRNTHTTFALRASDGAVLWQVTQPYPSVGGLLYAGGVVYHGSVDGTLHAMDAVSGEQLWMQQIGASLASGSSLVNGQLYTSFGFRFFLGSGPIEGGLTAWGL
ncbi:MAG TPA: PQQ-binding-like beta-propeller repeat protein, partial [Polyangiaceae bacterium]|nr:PQQ-binding-like beta-propeller repeat protein [Polyangiaceae bacterium]